MTTPPAFRFASADNGNRLVAGIPAAARLARAFALTGTGKPLVIVLPDGGALAPLTEAEIARLAPGLVVHVQRQGEGPTIPGETLPDAAAIAALIGGETGATLACPDPDAALRKAVRAVIKATGKAGDGIVSRHLNRPLSQAASGFLLRWAWVRPGHATALTALTALAMLGCLLSGTATGLVAGAVLFHLASVVDGIDGEIARATFRSSARGASLDSAVDAATNIGFLGGVIANLWLRGDTQGAGIGLAGLATLAFGMALLGRHAKARGEPLHFDGAKHAVAGREGPIMRVLRAITMRDFYSLALAVMIVIGLTRLALAIFAVAAAGWLITIIALLRRAPEPAAPPNAPPATGRLRRGG